MQHGSERQSGPVRACQWTVTLNCARGLSGNLCCHLHWLTWWHRKEVSRLSKWVLLVLRAAAFIESTIYGLVRHRYVQHWSHSSYSFVYLVTDRKFRHPSAILLRVAGVGDDVVRWCAQHAEHCLPKSLPNNESANFLASARYCRATCCCSLLAFLSFFAY